MSYHISVWKEENGRLSVRSLRNPIWDTTMVYTLRQAAIDKGKEIFDLNDEVVLVEVFETGVARAIAVFR